MDNQNNNTIITGGIGFCDLLGIVFIVLKLCGIGTVGDWSWWWVLAPFWIPAAFGVAVLIIIGIALLVIYIRDNRK